MSLGAAFERVEDGRVDQPDNRSDVAFRRRDLVDRERLVGVLFVRHHVERETFGNLFEQLLRLFRLLEQVRDLRERRDLDPQLLVELDARARRSG